MATASQKLDPPGTVHGAAGVVDSRPMNSALVALALTAAASPAFGAAAPAPHPLALARESSALAASPDGRTAFFVSPITGSAELWRAPSAGGWPQQLTESGAVSDPQLSPDGRAVAYAADGVRGDTDIFLMPAAGGDARNLTRSKARELAPRFSPDGRRLAYLSDAPGELQLFVLDMKAGASWGLTAGEPVTSPPAWSRDGRSLACARGGSVLLLDVSGEGGPARVLETGAQSVLSVAWGPSGQLLAVAESGGRRELLLLHPQWRAPRPAGPPEWMVGKAAWSAGGLVVLRRDDAGGSLHLLDRSGAPPRALTADGENVEDFALSGDGQVLLAFLREGPRSLLITRVPVGG